MLEWGNATALIPQEQQQQNQHDASGALVVFDLARGAASLPVLIKA